MITLPSSVRIYLATGAVDLRKLIDGLGVIVSERGHDLYSGHLYVFVSRRGDRLKILTWSAGGCARGVRGEPHARASRTAAALREAAIWERLSVGLHAAFLVWLKRVRRPAAVKAMILAARRKRQEARPEFDDIAIDDTAAVRAVQSVRRALVLRDRLAGRDELPHCDDTAFELGKTLVGSTPIDEVLAQLERRHVAAKGDDAWIRPRGRGKELAQDPGDTSAATDRASPRRREGPRHR